MSWAASLRNVVFERFAGDPCGTAYTAELEDVPPPQPPEPNVRPEAREELVAMKFASLLCFSSNGMKWS